jgi:hypothetical protein
MAQPASVPYPSSDNSLLLVRELKNHLETLAKHLQTAMENRELSQQASFLREFSDNMAALNKLLSSIPFKEIRPDLKPILEEMASALKHILNAAVEDGKAIMQESDLSLFFTSLVKYPESFQILIQELKLLIQDLNKYL